MSSVSAICAHLVDTFSQRILLAMSNGPDIDANPSEYRTRDTAAGRWRGQVDPKIMTGLIAFCLVMLAVGAWSLGYTSVWQFLGPVIFAFFLGFAVAFRWLPFWLSTD